MNSILSLAVAGLITWLMRASFIVLGPRDSMPPFMERVVAQARPAFLAALIASAFAARSGGEPLAIPLSWLLAAAIGIGVSWRTGSLFATGMSGMAVVAFLSFTGPAWAN
ncbi:MAG: AzlD domain-containing protein [Hyphomicrobiales bacterium]